MKGFGILRSCLLGTIALPLMLSASAHAQAASDARTLEHGAYVARAADCMACHTAGDGTPYGGGYVIASPMGNIYATNISPSKRYGIGDWTEARFARAIRTGVTPHGHLYPAMPYPAYAGMTDDDVHALYVYLMHGVKPVDRPPEHVTALDFPFSQRWIMAGWNILFGTQTPIPAAETKAGAPRRGEYLVKVLAHCSTCHTPRNALMGESQKHFLAGGSLGGWHVPNITSDSVTGIGGWSHDELVAYLRSGAAHGKSQAAGAMAEAVEHSLRFLSDDDLGAIADYLKTVPAIREAGQSVPSYARTKPKPDDLAMLDHAVDRQPDAMANGASLNGRDLFVGACASCHQLNGQGTADQFYPSLTANTATGGATPQNLVLAILKGVHRTTNDGTVAMPAFQEELTDAQVSAVADYVFQRFGNPALRITPEQVTEIRKGGETRPFLLTIAPIATYAGLLVLALLVVLVGYLLVRRKKV